jgi:hypothetical protein
MASFLKQSDDGRTEKPIVLCRPSRARSIAEARAFDDHVSTVAELLQFWGGAAGNDR